MQEYKKFAAIVCALIMSLALCVFLVLKDRSELLSASEAEKLLTESVPSKVELDENYIYFELEDKSYKVYAWALPSHLWSYALPVEPRNQHFTADIMGNLGIVIVLCLGLAVLFQVLRMFFFPQSRASGNPQVASSSASTPSSSPLMQDSLEPSVPISSSVTFAQVAGIDEVKDELLEIIDYLKNPKKYQDLGITLPKGVLLVGPPGVGKTMIAKAVAGEAGVPFFYQSGSSFVQIYVGMGAKRVRELFMRAKSKAPSIIFIDEIDAVGKARGNTRSDEREATLNQLLTEMDGFEDSKGVIVIAATNKIEVLDEALLRSGRFDRRIYVDLPDLAEREAILKVYLKDKQYELNLNEIARLCVGFSGAALALLVNEAALNALRRKSDLIQKEDILAVKDKVLVGKKKVLNLNEREKEILAFYQAAKALSAYWLEVDFDRIGLLAESFKPFDGELVSKQELTNMIKVALAGNVAMEMIYAQSFSNASDDIQKAKGIALQMCEQYGMAQRILGDMSDVQVILDEARAEIEDFLMRSKPMLHNVAQALLAQERLSKEEIKSLCELENRV